MPRASSSSVSFPAGWRAVGLVGVTFVYFLIFAQFAFLKRLAELGIADAHLKLAMSAMGAAGIGFSLLAAWLERPRFPAAPRLRVALAVCAAAALLTLLKLNLAASVVVAALIGAGLGLLTVTLVTSLRAWLGGTSPLLQVGLGTGLGYFLCNFPPLFTASPATQAIVAAVGCLLAMLIVAPTPPQLLDSCETAEAPPSFAHVLPAFTALVWLDSAAFFIIQSTPALKAGTWQGTAHLWTNAALHLGAALLSAWMLRRRGLGFVLTSALGALAAACLLLLEPARAPLASLFYPVGVSLYSVALVAYPALLVEHASLSVRARRAAAVYAVAGWFGSAMGIGMGQNLGYVPVAFVAMAALAVAGPQALDMLRRHPREAAVTAALLVVALALLPLLKPKAPPALSAVDRGRQVYLSEGCIHCHSQFVRPGTQDELLWGPTESIAQLRHQLPPMIGNRRQGPDLSEVGARRSPLWLRAHFENPRLLNPASFMPAYAFLFQQGSRGDDLVSYTASLNTSAGPNRLQQAWSPAQATPAPSDPLARGALLYNEFCATCHQPGGATRTRWQSAFRRQPPDLASGPWLHIDPARPQRRVMFARIVKFGLPGTDMPGHEYLPDADVSALALWLDRNLVQPRPAFTTTQEKP